MRRPDLARGFFPVGLTLLLLASRLDSVPTLSDPVSGAVPSSIHLSTPTLYLVLAPLFTLWDGISMLSMSRLKGFLLGLVVLYVIWRVGHWIRTRPTARSWRSWVRELGLLLISLGGLLLFLVAGAVWHRPMLSLAGTSPDDIVVDFHSHTNASHDVRDTWMRRFDLGANLRWHARAGFQAVFVTDHNVSRVSRVERGESPVISHQSAEIPAAVACPGIEVSAWQAHIVLLGDTLPVERGPYSRSLPGLLQLLRTSESAYGSVSLASLPEYRRSHWNRLDTLIQVGLDGFEVVNASPQANELTVPERDRVIELARRHNLFVVGVSDSHGWGATSMVWNLVQVQHPKSASTICSSILERLRSGFAAARILERHRLRPESRWPEWLTPLGVLWETWRGMGPGLTVAWLLWIWLIPLSIVPLRRLIRRGKIASRPESHSPLMDR